MSTQILDFRLGGSCRISCWLLHEFNFLGIKRFLSFSRGCENSFGVTVVVGFQFPLQFLALYNHLYSSSTFFFSFGGNCGNLQSSPLPILNPHSPNSKYVGLDRQFGWLLSIDLYVCHFWRQWWDFTIGVRRGIYNIHSPSVILI